jgi:hypothetical protein
MPFLKLLLSVFIYVVAATVMTVVYVTVQSRGAKAVGADVLIAWTIYSTLYWLLLAALLAALWWPLRRWLF